MDYKHFSCAHRPCTMLHSQENILGRPWNRRPPPYSPVPLPGSQRKQRSGLLAWGPSHLSKLSKFKF